MAASAEMTFTAQLLQNGAKALLGQEMAVDTTPASEAIVWMLIAMSVASLTVLVGRWIRYRSVEKQTTAFAAIASDLMAKGRLSALLTSAEEEIYKRSYFAALIRNSVNEALDVRERMGGLEDQRTIGAALNRTIELELQKLRKGLTLMATISSTAPFVGLLGTVLGIINAFAHMEEAGNAGLGAVAGSIAEALFLTGLGLLVAIPAVWIYNYLNGRVDAFHVVMADTSSQITDWFHKNSQGFSDEDTTSDVPEALGSDDADSAE